MDTSQEIRNEFIEVLCNNEVCLELMKNKFGSFVLEKALVRSKSGELKSTLEGNLKLLYASNIRFKWEEFLKEME